MAIGNETAGSGTPCASKKETHLISTSTARLGASTTSEAHPSDVPLVRNSLEGRGLWESATSLILQSWRKGTQQQYKPFIAKWEQYCGQRKIDPFSATLEHGINFLAELYQTGIGYSALNTARCAFVCVTASLSLSLHQGNFRMQTLSTKVSRRCDSGIRLPSKTWAT